MMKLFLLGAAALHALFMVFELFPWSTPFSLQLASSKLPKLPASHLLTDDQEKFFAARQRLTATAVHNAGIYNGIVAGGLSWAALAGNSAIDVAWVMLIGATVAGAFGTVTLKSGVTAFQALVGIIGLVLVWKCAAM
jgi:uncharacterized membrane protein